MQSTTSQDITQGISDLGEHIPDDLAAAISAAPNAASVWQGLAPSHRKEYLLWIDEAKKPETRAKRIAKTVEMILGKAVAPEKPKKNGLKNSPNRPVYRSWHVRPVVDGRDGLPQT